MTNSIIKIDRWGQDHWSTLAYLETRIVDYDGVVERKHMRCDPALHPHFAHVGSYMGAASPTRLADSEMAQHDDWSCLDDAEAEGLIQNIGTGVHRRYTLTRNGQRVANSLREYIARNKTTRGFIPPLDGHGVSPADGGEK